MDNSTFEDEEKRQIIRHTYAMVHQIDQAVGRIIQALKAHDIWDETIIVFTSDHGDFLGDHGRLRKGTVGSHALLHVPFILRAPGVEMPRWIDAPMSNADVLPTLTALTDVEPPGWLHGKDIRRVIQQGEQHHVFAFCANGNPAHVNYTIYDAQFRMTYYPFNEFVELFDHREDPGEATNLAGTNSRTVLRLMSILQERMLHYNNPILGRTGAW
jgi:arylsulfatase A-like enzyme